VSATRLSSPLVSILTPSFNQGLWLGDNIASVANQTYPRVEHIVADGGSTDETATVLDSAGSLVRWVSEPDRGQSDAINKAFRLSCGELIGWLNSDDAYFSRRSVELAVEAFRAHPDAAVVYGHSALVDGAGRLMHYNWAPPFSRRLLKVHNFIVQPAAFIRRSAVEEALVDERFDYSMDRELWLRLTERYQAVRNTEVLAIDRHHDSRKSYTRPDLYEHDHELLVERYGILPLGKARARLKIAKVALRIAGAPLALSPATRQSTACTIQRTATGPLLARQILLPRRVMSR
jgi:glycosyltransferase involved in cell wall biosynthesis